MKSVTIDRVLFWLLLGVVLAIAVDAANADTITFHYNYHEVGGAPQCPNPYGLGQNTVRYHYHVHIGHNPSVATHFAFQFNGAYAAPRSFDVATNGTVTTPGDDTYGSYSSPHDLTSTWGGVISDPAGQTGTIVPASQTLTSINACDNAYPSEQAYDVHIYVLGAEPTCEDDVHVTAHWDGGAPHAAGVVVNVIVGGYLAQVQCDANGCNSGTFPAAALNMTGSAPYNVEGGVDPHSWAICGVPGSRYQTTVTNKGAWPSSVACGGTVDIALDAHCATPSPTPSPSASVAPSPSTTPVITPSPSPSSTPLQYVTPPPNAPGTGVTNGGTTMSGITNQDIYNDVKQALDDAGNRDSTFTVPDGGFGFGSDPNGENGSAGNGLQSAVDRFTNDLSGSGDGLMEKVDAIDSLSLPTSIGDKSSWAVSLPVLGDLTIDLSTFDGPVWAFRSLSLAILVVGAWFAIVKIVRSGVA